MSSNVFAQIGAITALNVRNMSARLASSVVALVGIAGVVTVLIGVLSIREGFRAVLDLSGATDVAMRADPRLDPIFLRVGRRGNHDRATGVAFGDLENDFCV